MRWKSLKQVERHRKRRKVGTRKRLLLYQRSLRKRLMIRRRMYSSKSRTYHHCPKVLVVRAAKDRGSQRLVKDRRKATTLRMVMRMRNRMSRGRMASTVQGPNKGLGPVVVRQEQVVLALVVGLLTTTTISLPRREMVNQTNLGIRPEKTRGAYYQNQDRPHHQNPWDSGKPKVGKQN